jgi:hypothetical protein
LDDLNSDVNALKNGVNALKNDVIALEERLTEVIRDAQARLFESFLRLPTNVRPGPRSRTKRKQLSSSA